MLYFNDFPYVCFSSKIPNLLSVQENDICKIILLPATFTDL